MPCTFAAVVPKPAYALHEKLNYARTHDFRKWISIQIQNIMRARDKIHFSQSCAQKTFSIEFGCCLNNSCYGLDFMIGGNGSRFVQNRAAERMRGKAQKIANFWEIIDGN